MDIAILGAGLAGLATAWHVQRTFKERGRAVQVTLFDAQGIGGGASGIAAGLVSAFGGARATLLQDGQEGLSATLQLVQVAESQLQRQLCRPGILRLALREQQRKDFSKRVEQFPSQLAWWESAQVRAQLTQLPKAPALWIPAGYHIDTVNYLKGLWQACEQQGARLIVQKIHHWQELCAFDCIIATLGAQSLSFPELETLAAEANRGQMVGFRELPGIAQLPFALNSHSYIVQGFDCSCFWAGATYEHNLALDCKPNPDLAWSLLKPRLEAMLPVIREAVPYISLAGWRLSTPTYRPLIQQLDQRRWVLTGLGSKGLLYHALYARQLAQRLSGIY